MKNLSNRINSPLSIPLSNIWCTKTSEAGSWTWTWTWDRPSRTFLATPLAHNTKVRSHRPVFGKVTYISALLVIWERKKRQATGGCTTAALVIVGATSHIELGYRALFGLFEGQHLISCPKWIASPVCASIGSRLLIID
jgi:hypothetical protein